MPVYEYQCDMCQKSVDKLVKLNDTTPKSCEDCGGPLIKVIGVSSYNLVTNPLGRRLYPKIDD